MSAMVVRSIRFLSPFVLALPIASCNEGQQPESSGPAISYSVRDPGSTAVPSNPTSGQLIGMAGPGRLDNVGQRLRNLNIECAIVTGAVLKAGYGGLDVWRVSCSDSGDWLLSIDNRAPATAVSCTEIQSKTCYSNWQ
jgi:hypothetical protein